jgi:hypothetical protein
MGEAELNVNVKYIQTDWKWIRLLHILGEQVKLVIKYR